MADATSPMPAAEARLVRTAGMTSVAVAAALIALKLWGVVTTGSVALLGSLADSLLDLLASLITVFAVRVALTPADREHRFGHGKSEGVAGIAQAVIVSLSALLVAIRAVQRLLAPEAVSEPGAGYAVMVAALALTLGLTAFQRYVVRRTQSLAIRADAVHYQADVLTNVAVLAAIYLNAQLGWYAADPLLALVIVGVILASVVGIAKRSLDVLLDRELPAEVRREIRAIASRHPGVLGVHDIRTRSAGIEEFVQLHLEIEANLPLVEAHRIADEVEQDLRRAFPRAQVLIHTDPYGEPDERDRF
ncbi:MAG TPA: cation diffusion facilitator family transporter [Gammaproteobacteria bacterium]